MLPPTMSGGKGESASPPTTGNPSSSGADPPLLIFGSLAPNRITSSYQVLGSRPTPPSVFQSSLETISDASSPSIPSPPSSTPPDAPPGPSVPSTPSPTHRGRVQSSRSCRNRSWRSRSASPNMSSSATNCQSSSQKEEPIDLEQVKASFKSYLDRYCVGLAELMWRDQSFNLPIDYDELKAKNTALAYDIANHFDQVKSRLVAAAKEFLLEQYALKERRLTQDFLDKIQKLTSLEFSWMPDSIMSLDDFIKLNPTRTRWLFEGHKKCKHRVAELSPSVRKISQKVVAYVTSALQAGKTWNGKWEIGDWEVINNSYVHLRKDPIPIADRVMCLEDLKAIATKVLVKLIHESSGMIPAFLGCLQWQLQDPATNNWADQDFYGWYFEFLQFHPALMSSRARAQLIDGFYYAAVRLNYNKHARYQGIFGDTRFAPWNKFVWKRRRNIHDVLWDVYWDGFYPDMRRHCTTWRLPYNDTADHYLQYMRHLLQHSNKHSLWNGMITMDSSTEAELLAADKHRSFLPEFVMMIFKANRMEGELLKTWKFYKSTKDHDDE